MTSKKEEKECLQAILEESGDKIIHKTMRQTCKCEKAECESQGRQIRKSECLNPKMFQRFQRNVETMYLPFYSCAWHKHGKKGSPTRRAHAIWLKHVNRPIKVK